ncbi:MAG TPA: hypothetical protein VHF27_11160 [Acidimicrobiales bacterium]|nr:hypothetical protein [Acidimicrobiales bacterium]
MASENEGGQGFEDAVREAVQNASDAVQERLKAALSGLQGGGLSDDDVQALVEQFSSRASGLLETAASLLSIVPDVVERLGGGGGGGDAGGGADEGDADEGQAKPGGRLGHAVPADLGVTSPGRRPLIVRG